MATSTPVVTLKDVEEIGMSKAEKSAKDFAALGADGLVTWRDNVESFNRYRILPHVLRNVSTRDLRTTVLGEKVDVPFGIAPMSIQKLFHPTGEIGLAKAAQRQNTVFILSTLSSCSIEDIAEAAPNAIKWFQLYFLHDRQVVKNLIKRAEINNFKALVLTVDAAMGGNRVQELKNNFSLPNEVTFANLAPTSSNLSNDYGSFSKEVGSTMLKKDLNWNDLEWLISETKLPVVVKGVLRADDAKKAVSLGAKGIYVSNHGGRQMDTVPASIDVLDSISRAVASKCEIFLDSGVRHGNDVIKSLALGAKMVFVGRPALWGLAWDGENGVVKTLEILKAELDRGMALTGMTSIDIPKDLVAMANTSI